LDKKNTLISPPKKKNNINIVISFKGNTINISYSSFFLKKK
jgi:hypothetical protein